MDINDTPVLSSQVNRLNIKKNFIINTIIIILIILAGQFYQDLHREHQNLDVKRINLHQQQAKLSIEIMNGVLLVGKNLGTVSSDAISSKLQRDVKGLRYSQDQLIDAIRTRALEKDSQTLAKEESDLLQTVDSLLSEINNVLAAIEQETFDSNLTATLYKDIAPIHLEFQRASNNFIQKLTEFLREESYKDRTVTWAVSALMSILIIAIAYLFYKLISTLLHREFNLIEEMAQSGSEKELEAAHHAQLMSDQQNKMQSILDSTAEAIVTITTTGTIDSFNKAAETMFGYPASYAIGKNVKFLMPEPNASQHDSYLQKFSESGASTIFGRSVEVMAKRIDNTEFPILLSVSLVEGVEPPLFSGIIQDITARKKADTKLQNTLAELTNRQFELKKEEEIARHVFNNLTATNNDVLREVTSWSESVGSFSGDMMLSATLPSGALRILLCDFTGHGLPAALGAVPVSSIHNILAQKGLPLEVLMQELNEKLKELLPIDMFCCITGIDINEERTHASVWNAGLPDVLLIGSTGEIKQRLVSNHLPLGVVSYGADDVSYEQIELEKGDMFYIISDGLTEAESETKEMFGQERFEALLTTPADQDGRMLTIRNQVNSFVGKADPTDDISLVEIKVLGTTEDNLLES